LAAVADGRLHLWSLAGREIREQFISAMPEAVKLLTFATDGRSLALGPTPAKSIGERSRIEPRATRRPDPLTAA
jgi:hypothetical protein